MTMVFLERFHLHGHWFQIYESQQFNQQIFQIEKYYFKCGRCVQVSTDRKSCEASGKCIEVYMEQVRETNCLHAAIDYGCSSMRSMQKDSPVYSDFVPFVIKHFVSSEYLMKAGLHSQDVQNRESC